jgi:hypothetical protein
LTGTSDDEVAALLRSRGVRAAQITRRPYRYATSAPLEHVSVRTADGGSMELILKDLARERLLPDARDAKPEHVHDPRRELATYRDVLGPARIGPRCFAGDRLLLIEKVPGVELWQVGELDVWERVAEWAASLHGRFAGSAQALRRANPHLLEHTETWLLGWRDRAREALAGSADERADALLAVLDGYAAVAGQLAALPRTFVHGELYPSNVLVVRDREPPEVFAIDWEMAAIGPGLVDLAALVGGWPAEERCRLAEAYRRGLEAAGWDPPPTATLTADLARCRLQLAVQWLGWAPGWRPPPEHAHDWAGEALEIARELERS